MTHLKLRGYVTFALFIFLYSISFADNLPGLVEKANVYSFPEDLSFILYRNFDDGSDGKTLLERGEIDGRIESAVYQLKTGAEKWEDISKHTYLYDAQGIQTSDVFYTFSGNDWHPVSKENYLFDDNGNLLLKESYQYLSSSSSWSGTGEKIEREYNAMNQCTKYTVYTWINGNWKPLSEGTTAYSNNLPATSVYRSRIGESGELENSSYISYTYTGNNLPDTELYQSWTGSTWKDALKITYANSGSRITSKTIQYLNSENVFENLTKYEYEYINDVLSKIIKSERESGAWKETQTVNLTYSDNNVSMEEIGESSSEKWVYNYESGHSGNYFLYNEKDSELTGIIGYQYAFGENYLPLELIKYNRSEETGDWQQARSDSWSIEQNGESGKVIFKQKEISGTSLELKKQIEFIFGTDLSTLKKGPNALKFEIFPNPVREGFVIQLSETSSVVDYYISNTLGRLVTRGKISEHQNYIDASKLPAGQYIVTIVSEKGRASSVILKM